jgi:coenzyme F420-reducing hydrogenase delta subunit
LWKKLEQSGLNKDRLQLLWASAAEGERFASKIREMKPLIEKVTPEDVEKARKVFEKALKDD